MQTASRTRAFDGWAVTAAILAVVAVAGGIRHVATAKADVPRPAAVTAPAVVNKPAPARREAPAPEAVTRPASVELPAAASLRGTAEDGNLREDAAGHLVVGPEILRLFDYYLSASGEMSESAIRARVEAAVARHLGDRPSAKKAMDLFDRYLAYRRDAGRMSAAGDDLGQRLDALKKLRREHFGADADALFGDEERAVEASIQKRKAILDGSLSPEEREARLAAADAELPESVRAAHEAATRPLREAADEDAMRAAGATDAEIRAHRVATAGEEAADRLEELDRRRAAWKARLDAFRKARASIVAAESDPARRKAAIDRLLEQSFNEMERIRVEAADAMDAEAR